MVAAILTAVSAFGADSACKYLADANAKIYTIPAHLYQTDTAGGKTQTSELIYLNNKTYTQTTGKWRLSPMTPAKMAEIRKGTEDDEIKTMTCRVVRDEAVNGEAAVLYSGHQQSPDGNRDSQIWISKSRGVPLKLEMDIDGGAKGKSHRTIRYEYTNVQAPSGVQ
jgi:outer membrane lipoprotein-sorting protein